MLRHLLGALGACAIIVPAAAHVTLENREAPVGATYKAVLRVPHGCEGTATTSLRVRIPEGVIGVKPMPKPGWTLATVIGKYPQDLRTVSRQAQRGRDRDRVVGRQAAGRALRRVRVPGRTSRTISKPARRSTSRSCRSARRACIAGSRFRPRAKGRATIRNPRRASSCCRSASGDVVRGHRRTRRGRGRACSHPAGARGLGACRRW